MKRALMVAVMMSGPTAFAADDISSQLSKCAAISGATARLDCFDALAKTVSKPAGAQAAAKSDVSGNWAQKVSKNPIDDSQTVALTLIEENKHAILIIRCQQHKAEAYIGWDKYLGHDAKPVTLRMGDAPARTTPWSTSTDHKATFYPNDARTFAHELLATEQLVAQVTPYSSSPVTAIFDVRGLAQVITPFDEECKAK